MAKYFNKSFKEYFKTGFWLSINNLIASVIISVLTFIIFSLFFGISLSANQLNRTDLIQSVSSFGIVIIIALVLFQLVVLGVVFDKYFRKRV